MTGFFVGGLGCGAQDFAGVGIGGLGVGADDLRGAAIGLLVVKCTDARWFTAAAFNRVSSEMVGLQIGLINAAGLLHGVQIGILNYAGNNPSWARILPLVNLNL